MISKAGRERLKMVSARVAVKAQSDVGDGKSKLSGN